MRLACGCDLVAIGRFEDQDAARMARLFSPAELAEAQGRAQSLAGKFAAKEALAKACQTGIRPSLGLSFRDMEVLKDALGAPFYRLSPRLRERLVTQGLCAESLSISHTESLALAFCVLSFSEVQDG